MKANDAAQHLDCCLQQNDSGGAIHIVIAVKQYWLAGSDGAFEPLHRRGHSHHQQRIVQVRDFRIEEGVSFLCRSDAACQQQLGQHKGQPCFLGQGRPLLRV